MTFDLAAPVGQAGLSWFVAGGRAATKLKYWIWSDGCHDIGGQIVTCNAPGGRASGEFTLGESTPTGFKEIPHDTPGPYVERVVFNPMNPSLRIDTGSWGNFSSFFPNDGVCVSPSSKGGFLPASSGLASLRLTVEPDPSCHNNSFPFFCTAPSACFHASDDAQRRQCAVNPGKFAVIPFEGNAENKNDKEGTQGIVAAKVSWKVCCGCGQLGGTHH